MDEESRKINKENPKRGRDFEDLAKRILEKELGIKLKQQVIIKIGNPATNHIFDLVSEDGKIIIECKNYSWTKSGNVPSAKLAFLNEAAFYLSFLSENKGKYIVMRKCFQEKKRKTLAKYYYDRYKHLLKGIKVIEIDVNSKNISWKSDKNEPLK